jgi:hypothetical protein
MKKIITISLFSFFLSASTAFSQLRDTTINADINPNRKMEKIEVNFTTDGTYGYTLKVDNKEYKGELANGEYAYAELIDINQNDGYTEIAIVDVGPSDGHDTYIFRFTGEIIPMGRISGMSAPEPAGDGTSRAYWWMGFWGFNKHYKIDDATNTLVEVTQETYPVKDVEAVAVQSFELLAERNENSKVVATVNPGVNVKFIEADITPVCINSAGYEDEDECDWFLVESSDGATGWVQLKNFRDKVEGLIWAG